MHSTKEYCQVLETILETAQKIAQHVEQHTGRSEAREILQFCIRNGYIGYPVSRSEIQRSGWLHPLRGLGGPQTMEAVERAVAVVACFHDDETPGGEDVVRQVGSMTFFRPGYVQREQRLLVLTDVDLFSRFDVALVLLHEARHIRQYFGSAFEGLADLDSPDIHEVRTWEFYLHLLDECGGIPWQRAVEQEAVRLQAMLQQRGRSPGERYFGFSNVYCPELDAAFEPASHERVRQSRNILVAMRALFLLAVRHGVPDDIAHRNIVERYYEWAHGQ